jgi:hypothetical protein
MGTIVVFSTTIAGPKSIHLATINPLGTTLVVAAFGLAATALACSTSPAILLLVVRPHQPANTGACHLVRWGEDTQGMRSELCHVMAGSKLQEVCVPLELLPHEQCRFVPASARSS